MIQDRKKYPLPSWHADTELRAADLLGLEAYVLSRSQIIDEDAIGIDRVLDWRQSIRFEWKGSTGIVTIQDVRGVTPGGQAIWLGNGELLKIDIRLPPGTSVDAWISVNNDTPGKEKLTLDITAAEEQSPTPETINPDNLYLGRYRLPHPEQQDGQLTLERRPICRRLCAFGPVEDSGWALWVSPLRGRIETLAASNAGQTNRDSTSQALSAELLRLTFEWPVLPIPHLARRLRMIGWLMSFDTNGRRPDTIAAVDPIDWEFLTGENLPITLAGFLPQPQEKVATGLPESLPVLLDLLNSIPVNFHAPIGLLKQWTDELVEAKKGGLSDHERRALAGRIEGALTQNEWSKAVALITAMNLNLRISSPDVTGATAATLDQIYKTLRDGAKDRLPAGPMAFYWLARAACLQAGFVKRRFQTASGYFSRMEGGAHSGGSDRIVQYLVERTTKAPIDGKIAKDVTPFLWWKKLEPRDLLSGLRITVAGSRSSGKSSLVRRLITVSGSGSHTAYPETGAIETRGFLASHGSRMLDASILEVDTSTDSFERLLRGSSSDPVVAALVETHLLVLCIAPGETDEWCSNALKELSVWMQKRCPRTIVAIAYTKADEYGVVEEGGIRFVHSKIQADQLSKMQTANDPKREWDFFVQGKKETNVQAGRTGDLSWVSKKAALGDSPTKQHILENTATLWRSLVNNDGARSDLLLNGYFIAAESRDPEAESYSQWGVAQLLSDFFACLKGGG